jgi:hypothetical protein
MEIVFEMQIYMMEVIDANVRLVISEHDVNIVSDECVFDREDLLIFSKWLCFITVSK